MHPWSPSFGGLVTGTACRAGEGWASSSPSNGRTLVHTERGWEQRVVWEGFLVERALGEKAHGAGVICDKVWHSSAPTLNQTNQPNQQSTREGRKSRQKAGHGRRGRTQPVEESREGQTGLCSHRGSPGCVPPLARHPCRALRTSAPRPPPVTSAEASRGRLHCFFAMTRHLGSSRSSTHVRLAAGLRQGAVGSPGRLQGLLAKRPAKVASLLSPVSPPCAEYSAPDTELQSHASLSTLGCHNYFHLRFVCLWCTHVCMHACLL